MPWLISLSLNILGDYWAQLERILKIFWRNIKTIIDDDDINLEHATSKKP